MHQHIAPLTGLRFLLALHVVAFHLGGPLADKHPLLAALFSRGYLAVGGFFVLSGFILTYTYLQPSHDGRLNRRAFWVARFARIYPVYVLALAVAAPLFVLSNRDDPATLLTGALSVPSMVQSWLPGAAQLWNGPAWSLSAEAFFYLAFPFFAPALGRLGARGLIASLVVAMGLAFAIPGALFYAHLAEHSVFNPLVRLPEFAAGVVLGHVFVRSRRDHRMAEEIRWAIVGVCAAAALVIGFALAGGVALNWFGPGLVCPAFAALIFSLARSGRYGLGRVLSVPFAVLLGEASYAVYLLHVPLRGILDVAARRGLGSTDVLATPWAFPVQVGLIVGVSIVVFLTVERPARAAIRRRMSA